VADPWSGGGGGGRLRSNGRKVQTRLERLDGKEEKTRQEKSRVNPEGKSGRVLHLPAGIDLGEEKKKPGKKKFFQ